MKSQHNARAMKALAIAGTAGLLAALSACGTIDEGSGGGADDGTIRIAYIQKQGDQQYFIDQADGAKEMATSSASAVCC